MIQNEWMFSHLPRAALPFKRAARQESSVSCTCVRGPFRPHFYFILYSDQLAQSIPLRGDETPFGEYVRHLELCVDITNVDGWILPYTFVEPIDVYTMRPRNVS